MAKAPSYLIDSKTLEHTTIRNLTLSMVQGHTECSGNKRIVRSENAVNQYYNKELIRRLIAWPPDLYAVCSEILRRSGTYIDVAHEWPITGKTREGINFPGIGKDLDRKKPKFLEKWTEEVRAIANEWQTTLGTIYEGLAESIRDLKSNYDKTFPNEYDELGDLLRTIVIEKSSSNEKLFDNKIAVVHVLVDLVFRKNPHMPIQCLKGAAAIQDRIDRINDRIGKYELELRESKCEETKKNLEITIFERRQLEKLFRDARMVSLAVIELVVLADETCAGIGFRDRHSTIDSNSKPSSFLTAALEILEFRSDFERSASLLAFIRARNTVVLPKALTSNRGTSHRGLTHHLALIRGGEVVSNWFNLKVKSSPSFERSLTLLLIPFPWSVFPSQFAPVDNDTIRSGYARHVRYFKYEPKEDPSISSTINAILDKAKSEIGNIDGVVLPEMALSQNTYNDVRDKLFIRHDINPTIANSMADPRFLLSGVIGPSEHYNGRDEQSGQSEEMVKNKAIFSFQRMRPGHENETMVRLAATESKEQHKHHRWHLNDSQIRQYGIGAQLHANNRLLWAEYMEIPRRRLQFFVMNEQFVVTTLICEDLAQSDPIGDVIRAVGPNLVIALLADGPQLKHRWPAKSATNLADDPGSSVLTLTSLGFANLSRPSDLVRVRKNVVALWKDQITGTTEIEFPSNSEKAVVLSLSIEQQSDVTLDGRKPSIPSQVLTLSGIHFIKGD